jgi:glyoxylase-like metal-dependent hydrolase (beta-lactamase superfamily II)
MVYVSAYVLVRGREAALVDAGIQESAQLFGAVLQSAGPGWAGVRHIVITHAHGDHWEGLEQAAHLAPGATLYAGTLDAPHITSARSLRTVADGDEVFGLRMVATPGHTAGHVAVFDADSALLVAGDALTNPIHGLAGPWPTYTEDAAEARNSVRKLADLEPRTSLFGHGPPVERDAAAQLRRLANTLT